VKCGCFALSNTTLTPHDCLFPPHASFCIQRPSLTHFDADMIICLQALQDEAGVPLIMAAQSKLLPHCVHAANQSGAYLPLIILGGGRFAAFNFQYSDIRLR
jgi:hypothetical protein